jgi:hypothetical protein
VSAARGRAVMAVIIEAPHTPVTRTYAQSTDVAAQCAVETLSAE